MLILLSREVSLDDKRHFLQTADQIQAQVHRQLYLRLLLYLGTSESIYFLDSAERAPK